MIEDLQLNPDYQFSICHTKKQKVTKEQRQAWRKVKLFYKNKPKEDYKLYRLIIFLYIYYSNRDETLSNIKANYRSKFLISFIDIKLAFSYFLFFSDSLLVNSLLLMQMKKCSILQIIFFLYYNLYCIIEVFYVIADEFS